MTNKTQLQKAFFDGNAYQKCVIQIELINEICEKSYNITVAEKSLQKTRLYALLDKQKALYNKYNEVESND